MRKKRPIEQIGVVRFHPSQRERFRSGELARKWLVQYPDIFDEEDLRLGLSQPGYHFFAWFGAVVLFSTTGYLSLVEKCEFEKHSRKYTIVKETVPSHVFAMVQDRGVQCQDLFIYADDRSDRFFCEIEGKGDRLHKAQREYFESLYRCSGKPVQLLKLKEMTVRQVAPPDRGQPATSRPSFRDR